VSRQALIAELVALAAIAALSLAGCASSRDLQACRASLEAFRTGNELSFYAQEDLAGQVSDCQAGVSQLRGRVAAAEAGEIRSSEEARLLRIRSAAAAGACGRDLAKCQAQLKDCSAELDNQK